MRKVIWMALAMMVLFTVLMSGTPQYVNQQKIKCFMDRYYRAFNLYAQDPQTIDRMDEFWAPEFIAVQYLPLPQYPVMNLTAWKNLMVYVHGNVKETLTVDEMSIDPTTLTVTARLSISFHYRSTGELALKTDAIAFYNLKTDRRNALKQTAIKLYFANPGAVMELSGPPPAMQ